MAALRLVLVTIEHFLLVLPSSPNFGLALILTYFIVAHVIVHVWQVVGVMRALDRHQGAYGSITVFWGVVFGIVVGMILTAAAVFTSTQSIYVAYRAPVEVTATHPPSYALRVAEDGTRLSFTGEIHLGVTPKLELLTAANPHIRLLTLESPGGNTFAARGLARVIQQFGLDTHVESECYSACTIAFIAGRKRTLGKSGRLGFHQYGIDSLYQIPFAEPAREQEKDIARFREQGIAEAFLGRIFDKGPNDTWHPMTQELVAAGVISQMGQ